MTRPLNVAVIGAGLFGESHIRAWRSVPGVRVAAVVSRSQERADELAHRYDVEHALSNLTSLFAIEGIDAVSVTTSEHEHREPVTQALSHNISVIVEKPMATTLADADDMIIASQKSRGILMPGHILRFDPRYIAVHDAIATGALGDIVSIHARRNRTVAMRDNYRRVHPALISAIHDIDAILWCHTFEVLRVYAVDRLIGQGVRHGIWGTLEFSGGAVATVEASWHQPARSGKEADDSFRVIGTDGQASLQTATPSISVAGDSALVVPDVSFEHEIDGLSRGALSEELAHFARVVRDGDRRKLIVTPEDGRRALRIALAMMESAASGNPIELTPV